MLTLSFYVVFFYLAGWIMCLSILLKNPVGQLPFTKIEPVLFIQIMCAFWPILIPLHLIVSLNEFKYRLIFEPSSITLDDQEEACKTPRNAYLFAVLNIRGTDIRKCQKAACADKMHAYLFARDVRDADIEYCRIACISSPVYLKHFDKMIAEKNEDSKCNQKTPG